MSLVSQIASLKKKKNAVILAHYYQRPEIQVIADYVGDSLGLAYQAAKTDADIIVFAGVTFMAETAKIISPNKKVLLPDLEAGCSLADYCPPELFEKFISQYPNHLVVTYVNCQAEIKAMSDIVCTSANALKIINSIPKSQPIVFAPDKHLGKYLIEKSGRDLVLWNGSCIVHETFSEEKILSLKKEHPGSKIIAHPECAEVVIMIADFIGSTSELIKYATTDSCETFVVVTEVGILHEMSKAVPNKKLIPAPPSFYTSCNCGECPYMKMNSLEKILECLRHEKNEITVDSQIAQKALKAIDKMFELTLAP
ncbi:MAG: quinolinate synthase NadA [Cytophagaceae bacterium]